MKRVIYLILCLFLTGIFFVNTFAQRTEITKEDFYQRYNPMIEKTEKQARRISFLQEQTFIKVEQKTTIKKIVKIIPPDKIHFNTYYDDTFATISETMYIGNTMYHKQIESLGGKANNIWEMTEGVKPKTLWSFKPPSNLDNTRFFLTENVQINGQITDLIECIYQRDIKAKSNKTKEIEDFKLLAEYKYWINKDNLLIKSEHYQGDNNYLPMTLRLIYEYEYDPNIKIEAPIINKELEK